MDEETARAPDEERKADGSDSTLADTHDDREVAPTEPIYGWSPERATCEVCGEAVTQRWRDDGRMVCGDCKEW